MLLRIPEHLIPFAVLGFGGLILVVVTVIHGIGLDRVINRYQRMAEGIRKSGWHPRLAIVIFGGTILLLLILHIVEICLWGIFLWSTGLIPDYHSSVYFSANAYTTLGMGPMPLPHAWHELCPIIAICGLFTFAWTTSEMFNIVGYQRQLVADLIAKHKLNSRVAAGS